MTTAALKIGTLCSLRDFIREAGTTQVSAHLAPQTSPLRAAVSASRCESTPTGSWRSVAQGNEGRSSRESSIVGLAEPNRFSSCTRSAAAIAPLTDDLQPARRAGGEGPSEAVGKRRPATSHEPTPNRSAADRSERRPPCYSESASDRWAPLLRPTAGGCCRRPPAMPTPKRNVSDPEFRSWSRRAASPPRPRHVGGKA